MSMKLRLSYSVLFEGSFRTQRRRKFPDCIRPSINICLIVPSWRQSFNMPPAYSTFIYSRVPNKRIDTLFFSKQICLFWQVLIPIRAVLTSISALIGVKTDPNKRICLKKLLRIIVSIRLLGTRE